MTDVISAMAAEAPAAAAGVVVLAVGAVALIWQTMMLQLEIRLCDELLREDEDVEG